MPEGLPGGRGMLRLQIDKCRCITRYLHNTFDFQTRCKQEAMKNMLFFALAEVVDKLRMKKRILTRIFQCMTNENRTEKLYTQARTERVLYQLKGFTTTRWASLVPGLLTNRLYATVSALVAQEQDSQLGKQTQLVPEGWQIVTSYCEVMEFQHGAIWAKTLLRQSSMQFHILRR